MIQAVLFSKTYTTKQINKWLSEHNLKSISHRTTEHYKRYRILSPDYNKYVYRIQHNKSGPDFNNLIYCNAIRDKIYTPRLWGIQ